MRDIKAIITELLKNDSYDDDNGCFLSIDSSGACICGSTPYGQDTFMVNVSDIKPASDPDCQIKTFLEFWDDARDDRGHLCP